MGLLDEAIREHLDLKRRRGGDPAEIEREERDALGPVRRHRDPATVEESDAFGEDAGEEQLVSPAYDEPDEPIAGDLAEQAPTVEEPEPALTEDAPATRVMRARDLPAPGDMTAEYDVEGALAAEAGAPAEEGDEDVLEETPEFLQDTPDHDRLWFEQRPPRDFDFDG